MRQTVDMGTELRVAYGILYICRRNKVVRQLLLFISLNNNYSLSSTHYRIIIILSDYALLLKLSNTHMHSLFSKTFGSDK